jgi:hypothetical protein
MEDVISTFPRVVTASRAYTDRMAGRSSPPAVTIARASGERKHPETCRTCTRKERMAPRRQDQDRVSRIIDAGLPRPSGAESGNHLPRGEQGNQDRGCRKHLAAISVRINHQGWRRAGFISEDLPRPVGHPARRPRRVLPKSAPAVCCRCQGRWQQGRATPAARNPPGLPPD